MLKTKLAVLAMTGLVASCVGAENTTEASIRKNIERSPKESEAFKRYLKKFDDQETEIEKRQARLKELRIELAKHEKGLKDYAETAKAE